jgi:hypothetical protein
MKGPSVLRGQRFREKEYNLFSTNLVEAPTRLRYISYVTLRSGRTTGVSRKGTATRGNT